MSASFFEEGNSNFTNGADEMKRFFLWLTLLMLCPVIVLGEALPTDGAAPYAPVASAYSEDGMSYDDGTLSIRIETDYAYDTNIYYAYVTLTDASQLRTALAGTYPSKTVRPVSSMAEENNAVLAINGDYFSYHHTGVVVRNGQVLREQPVSSRDTLLIDSDGNFTILTKNTRKEWEEYSDKAVQAFCFGPGLVINGEKQTFKAGDKVSCGANTKAQRLAICQLDILQYLIIATEGPEQDGQAGLTIAELTELMLLKGVQQGYNLDGGSSTTLWFNGQRINAPESKNRNVGDIIYFATLVSAEE